MIGHFKEDAGEWEQLVTRVEWETKTASAEVDTSVRSLFWLEYPRVK